MADKENETWKDIFIFHTQKGKEWKELFGEELHNRRNFLERETAVYLCQKAQYDKLYELIDKYEDRFPQEVLDSLREEAENIWEMDETALGMEGPEYMPLKPLDEFNKEVKERAFAGYSENQENNGIACPECGGEMKDTTGAVLLSFPGQKHVKCKVCGYKSKRYC